MDEVDKQILRSLAANSRISLKVLAAKVGLAAPSTSDRLRRLEERGQIMGYTIDVDLQRLGYVMVAMVRINPQPGKLRMVERLIVANKAVIECDKVTGEDCFFVRVCLKSLDDLDAVLEPFHDHAHTVTCIVKSQPVRRRLPRL
jgi:Lrp/AsnC family transcriptional regulator, leucine-responsive regulatory protein